MKALKYLAKIKIYAHPFGACPNGWAKGAKGAKSLGRKPCRKLRKKADSICKNCPLRICRLGLVQAAWAKGAKMGKRCKKFLNNGGKEIK